MARKFKTPNGRFDGRTLGYGKAPNGVQAKHHAGRASINSSSHS
jgi:hypothetical protein